MDDDTILYLIAQLCEHGTTFPDLSTRKPGGRGILSKDPEFTPNSKMFLGKKSTSPFSFDIIRVGPRRKSKRSETTRHHRLMS